MSTTTSQTEAGQAGDESVLALFNFDEAVAAPKPVLDWLSRFKAWLEEEL